MISILRAFGVVCSMIIAAISLYSFTMFWVGIDDNIKHKKATINKPMQITSFITSIEQFCREKRNY